MMSSALAGAVLSAAAALAQQIPVEGNRDSAVRVLIFEDLQCSDCAGFRRMMDEKLLPKYAGSVAFIHRDFPLPRHTWARDAAVAARYLSTIRPELSLEFRRETLARIGAIAAGFDAHLEAFALRRGLDPAKLKASLRDKRFQELVEKDVQEGVARGVSKTPTVFVNGKPFIETFAFEDISSAIDRALQEKP
jgi:protein-disulfide isomerase